MPFLDDYDGEEVEIEKRRKDDAWMENERIVNEDKIPLNNSLDDVILNNDY